MVTSQFVFNAASCKYDILLNIFLIFQLYPFICPSELSTRTLVRGDWLFRGDQFEITRQHTSCRDDCLAALQLRRAIRGKCEEIGFQKLDISRRLWSGSQSSTWHEVSALDLKIFILTEAKSCHWSMVPSSTWRLWLAEDGEVWVFLNGVLVGRLNSQHLTLTYLAMTDGMRQPW